MLKAVIFDMDGVIIDSEPLHARAAILAAEKYGVHIDNDFCSHYIGSPAREMFGDILTQYKPSATLEQLISANSYYNNQLLKEAPYTAIEGIPELVKDLTRHGIRLAIASSSTLGQIENVLRDTKLSKYFQIVVSGATIPHPKPSPDIFLKALSELGIRADEAVVIEDSYFGVCAARSAGIACLGYINPNSGRQDLSQASLLTESFKDIGFSYMENLLKRCNGEPILITKTKRLVLRELAVSDIPMIYQIYQNPNVRKYIDDLDDYLETEMEKQKAYIKNVYGFYGYGLWGVFNRDGSTLIGRSGIQNTIIDGRPEIELSYLLDEKHWGMGYALECSRAVLTYAARELGIDNVVAVIDEANLRSIKVALRNGMHMEKELWHHGRRCFLFRITNILETLRTYSRNPI